MPISSNYVQLNIASSMSFQLRAGSATIFPDESQQSQRRLEPHQARKTDQLKRGNANTQWQDQAAYYEVVGPYADGAPASRSGASPATISALSVGAVDKAAFPPPDRYINIPYRKNGDETELVYVYNQSGQRVFATTQSSTIDFFV